MKFFLFTLFIILANSLKSQIPKSYFGMGFKVGVMQQNYNGLHKYNHLLNSTKNFSFTCLSTTASIGNRANFFATFSTSIFLPHLKNGDYLNDNITASSSIMLNGLIFDYPFYKSEEKSLTNIFVGIGPKWISNTIQSFSNSKSSFHNVYEHSKVRDLLLSLEITLELFDFNKKNTKLSATQPLVITTGYNFQVMKPLWSGKYIRNLGDENPAINLGGFYFEVGMRVWLNSKSKLNATK